MREPAVNITMVEPWGDQAFLVRLGSRIDPVVNARAQTLAARLRQQAPDWLVDCVPSYAAVLIQFDLAVVAPSTVESFLRRHLTTLDDGTPASQTESRLVEIPVCYAPALAPDIADVAAACRLSQDDLIRRHTFPEYRVYMLGFRPGFPFLGAVDPSIAVPRLPTPRARVAAGSVGIAGRQTGIYPTAGPGGWRIVGRTPWRLFAPAATPPFRLTAGDRVRFVSITTEAFAELKEDDDAD